MLRNARFSHIGIASLVLAALLALLATIFGAIEGKTLYVENHGRIERQFFRDQMQAAERTASGATDYILYRQSMVETTERQAAGSMLKTASTIATRLYDSYHTLVPEHLLKRQILDSLDALAQSEKPARFSVRSPDGHELLMQGSRITHAATVVDAVRASAVFAPYGWRIRVTVAPKPFLDNEKAQAMDWTEHMYSSNAIHVRIVKDSYNLVPASSSNSYEGTPAATEGAVGVYGEYAKRQAFVRIVSIARSEGRGFVEDLIPDRGQRAGSPEIEYVRRVPDSPWLVVTDVSHNLLTARLREYRATLVASAQHDSARLFLLLLIAVLLLVVLFYGYATVTRSIRRFTSSFRRAASHLESIDIEDLHYREFREAAAYVNRIVDDRKRVDQSLRASEERLLQAQKMEAIGRFAGGIAHDFNNLLTVIIGYADMALMNPDLGRVGRSALQQVRGSATGAAKLTHQLLAFSRRQVLRPVVVDPNQLLENIEGMLRPIIGEDITLAIVLDYNSGCFEADEGQIEQVILNLVINARDAMPEGGTLTIRTRAADLTDNPLPDDHPTAAGHYVLIEVSDDGIGMDSKTLGHLFEPFFTTKEVGKGTGLGLSTVYGIVTQSNGHVTVSSETGLGSTFRLFFPCVAVGRQEEEQSESSESPGGRNEKILVVEDEESVRKMVVSTLKKAGYQVLEANGGLAALTVLYETKGSAIDLILSDVIMPDMTGDQLMNRLPSKHSGTPVLYMTGYDGRRDLGDAPVLHKPFSPSVVKKRIRELLDFQAVDRGARRTER